VGCGEYYGGSVGSSREIESGRELIIICLIIYHNGRACHNTRRPGPLLLQKSTVYYIPVPVLYATMETVELAKAAKLPAPQHIKS